MTTLNNTDGQNFYIPNTKTFIPTEIKRDYVNETLDFAYARPKPYKTVNAPY